MKKKNLYISAVIVWLILFSSSLASESSGAILEINSRTIITLELVGYDGLKEASLAKLTAYPEKKATIETTYNGLALLAFDGGQSYPLILRDEILTLIIDNASKQPTFSGSEINTYFYNLLAGKTQESDTVHDEFAHLMIQSKTLLKSSSDIRTTTELQAKRKELTGFVGDNYGKLKNSDMIRRFVAQSFMMHEYVNYHTKGEPAINIKRKYQAAVLKCVKGWIETLKPHIPEYEILNYIVSLYYDRSMVSMASFISNSFKEYAFCPGTEEIEIDLGKTLVLTDKARQRQMKLFEIQGNKILSFVSEECPVSMVQAVSLARLKDGSRPKYQIIVVPVEKLSAKHLTMGKMLSTGNLYFVQDEEWIKKNVPGGVRLPHLIHFSESEDNHIVDEIAK